MHKLILFTVLVSSSAFATVRYPISVAVSPDGKTTVVRGVDRSVKSDLLEASGTFNMSLIGGENQFQLTDHGIVQFLSPSRLLVTKFNNKWFSCESEYQKSSLLCSNFG